MKPLPLDAPRPRLQRQGRAREIVNLLVFLVAVYALLELAIPRSVVLQTSMTPTLLPDQRLLISRVSYLFGEPKRGDIVVFIAPNAKPDDPPLIKRLIGLPGEKIEFRDQSVYINDVKLDEPYLNEPCTVSACEDAVIQIGANEFFFMGDNRNHSRDSRVFGPVPRNQLVGRAILRWWPPALWGILSYNYKSGG